MSEISEMQRAIQNVPRIEMASFDVGSISTLEKQRNTEFDSSLSESIGYREPNLSVHSLNQVVDSNSSKSSLSSLYSGNKRTRNKMGH